jgi:cystathionine beta-lyase/cystathionine gamma-synthase
LNTKDQDSSSEKTGFQGADPRFTGKGMSTQCIHAGELWEKADYLTPVAPIYTSTSFFYENFQDLIDMIEGRKGGYGYSRWSSPTTATLERAISTLEAAGGTIACSSGMAAIHLALLSAGAKEGAGVLCSNDVYGSSIDLLKEFMGQLGVEVLFCDFTNLDQVEDLLNRRHPGVVLFEVLTNPVIKVVDAPAVIKLAHQYGARVIVDNTFTTPYLFRPFTHGADFVCSSVSKYLAGHGDVLAGAISSSEDDTRHVQVTMAHIGSALHGLVAWLALRGLKTFSLRMEKHCQNALELARFLQQHPLVENVSYPGLESHLQHPLANRLFPNGCYGGMISFDLVGGSRADAFCFLDSLNFAVPTGSLGDVHSLVIHPASTTHHTLSPEAMEKAGISNATLRISVGIEDIEDLKEEIDQALAAVSKRHEGQ